MTVFIPDSMTAPGKAIVLCPGGSYMLHSIVNEGTAWAPYFNDMGIVLAVLKYQLPEGDPSKPISDLETAIKTVRDSAQVWNVNPNQVGIMGFSAGGHLVSTVATHSSGNARPDFQILGYPLIFMHGPYSHQDSHNNFMGPDATEEMEILYSNQQQVTERTPRAFIATSDDDKAVNPANSVEYYLALNRAGVPATLHVYPSGGHGWGIIGKFQYRDCMLKDLSSWLNSF